MAKTGRFRIRKQTPAHPAYSVGEELHPDGTPTEPYGLWDTWTHQWVNKWGEPDLTYSACCRGVALMRRRDMNGDQGGVIF